jgi:hypothetical protein
MSETSEILCRKICTIGSNSGAGIVTIEQVHYFCMKIRPTAYYMMQVCVKPKIVRCARQSTCTLTDARFHLVFLFLLLLIGTNSNYI